MKKKHKIIFHQSQTPITELVTKFGGQPVWLEKPEWAVSETTGKPMMFICQIALDQELFGGIPGKMAYLFMENENEFSKTWDAGSGDNAVIIQPSGNNYASIEIVDGPSLYLMEKREEQKLLEQTPCEFSVELIDANDPDSYKLFDEDSDAEQEIDEDEYDEAMQENKIGGTPIFMQGEQYPTENKEDWNLLLQLDSCSVPFYINFGDAGIGYAFISKDGRTGKFLWQCA